MDKNIDLGLATILEVNSSQNINVDEELIKLCFHLQKKYQFSHDRPLSTNAMENAINNHVDKLCAENESE